MGGALFVIIVKTGCGHNMGVVMLCVVFFIIYYSSLLSSVHSKISG